MQRSSERGPRSLIWDLEIGVVPLGRWDGTHQPDDTAMEGIVGWSFPVRQCIGYAGDACFVLFLIPPKYRPKYSISSASVCLGKSRFGDVEPLPALQPDFLSTSSLLCDAEQIIEITLLAIRRQVLFYLFSSVKKRGFVESQDLIVAHSTEYRLLHGSLDLKWAKYFALAGALCVSYPVSYRPKNQGANLVLYLCESRSLDL